MEEDIKQLSKKIKSLRKKMGYSQKRLSEGICTQSFLSMIENGVTSPSAVILQQLAYRLGVSTSYFIDTKKGDASEDPFQMYQPEIRKSLHERDYQRVEQILIELKKSIHEKNDFYDQFMYWMESLISFYIYKNSKRAFKLIEQALELHPTGPQVFNQYVEIMSSKAIILASVGDYPSSISLFEEIFSNYLFSERIDSKIYIRACYNYAGILLRVDQVERSLEYAEFGINKCLEEQIFHFLDDLFISKGVALYKLKKYELSLASFERALSLGDLDMSSFSKELVQKNIQEVTEAMLKSKRSFC